MHYARSLVRPVSQRSLRSLETQAAASNPIVGADLVDADGSTQSVAFLHPSSLAELMSNQASQKEALNEMTRIRAAVAQMGASITKKGATGAAKLYVKGTVESTAAELRQRQDRLLAKWEGRILAGDFDEVSVFVKGLLDKSARDGAFSDAEVATYRGIVETLCATDAEAALAMALNTKLPPLNAATSSALAKIVDITSEAAIKAFFTAFLPRDAQVAACETCATQLACRLCHELHRAREANGPRDDAPVGVPDNTEMWSRMLSLGLRDGNVDPSVVLTSDVAAIQKWASVTAPRDALPRDQARKLRSAIRERRLQPRRATMDALSALCLEDLEREWIRGAVFGYNEDSDEAAKTSAWTAQEGGGSGPGSNHSFRQQSLSLILKDPKRYLIGNRLLREYATLLEQGYIDPEDASFAAFLEECGECHDHTASGCTSGKHRLLSTANRPNSIRFTMKSPVPGVSVLSALKDLAPFCSYWTTLLATPSLQKSLSVRVAPFGDLRVEVSLPPGHECLGVVQARAKLSPATLPPVDVLYEDESVLVVNKPAGTATSRHALSCTQLGGETTDLVSTLLVESRDAADAVGKGRALDEVFRQGQVHRLDRDTSGCIVIAKTNHAMDSLRHQMGTSGAFDHEGKVYLALSVVLEPQLNRVPLRGTLVDPSDRKVHTNYRILRFLRKSRMALVECRIQQGKKHQIRRHLAAAGLPILGDLDHGGASCCTPLISRVALHARQLTVVHPETGEVLSLAAPLPHDFRTALLELDRV